ncbi:MAG: tetratricopeptide repeat protein [Candidatus Kapabacteria bacterium]|nr:tetratricopeptide repeat protein [Candidatus Kapabacteria bacterium]
MPQLQAESPSNGSIDSLERQISALPSDKSKADAIIALALEHWNMGIEEEMLQEHLKTLKTITERLKYRKGHAYWLIAMARYYEKRDNIKFGKFAYDALERINEFQDPTGRALAEKNIASFHFYAADYDLATRYFQQALERFQETNNRPQTAWTLYSLAIIYGYQGNYVYSLSHQFKALRIFETLNIRHGIAASNEDLGIALLQIGSIGKALEYLQKAGEEYGESLKGTELERLASIYINIASCKQQQGSLVEALDYLAKAKQYTLKPQTTQGFLARSSLADALGNIAQKQQNKNLAVEYFQEALAVLDSAGLRGNDLNYALYRIASIEFQEGSIATAERTFHRMLARSLESGDKRNSARALLWLGKVAFRQNQFPNTERFAKEAFAAAQAIGQLEFTTSAAELLSTVYEKQGNTALSLQYAKTARKYRDSIATLERTQQLAGMEAIYTLDKERAQLENLRRDNETQLLATQRLRLILWGGLLALVLSFVALVTFVRLNNRSKRANEELARQTERIKAISLIGAEIAANLNLQDAIVMIYSYINQLMDAPIFNIGEYLPHEEAIQMRYLIENGEFVAPPRVSMLDSLRPAVKCVLTRSPVVINDGNIPVLVGAKPESLVYVPLVAGEVVIGVFSVQSFKQQSYPQQNVDMLTAISAYIATAITNTNAFERIKAQQAELEQQASLIQLNNVALSERNITLERLNHKIQENIAYAQTIQEAVLPSVSELTEQLPNHFVLYKPMEVISGDFYWMQRMEFATLVAVVDCTGHGIPGAFMSMIGNDLLNQIVLEKNITNPAWILTELHYAVRHALRQTNNIESNQDGMDICLCRIDAEGITFAGARRPLYIVQNGEILTIEGDRKPIGGFQREGKRAFTSKRLDLDKSTPTMLYLTTDGYADQHNAKREKFGIKQLTELFAEISGQTMFAQREHLGQSLAAHQGTVSQRDDITIMGIRIG